MKLTSLTLRDVAPLLETRRLSPVELTQAYLDRIDTLDPLLNCFITVTPEQALDQAREAEQAIGRGRYGGVLHGIPIAYKDLFETAGIRTTAGAKFLSSFVPEEDAAVVEKLRRAGTVMLGKLNMHEWAMSVTTDNPHFGPCKNPWDPERIPGGSSGGSGAALAAGMCVGSLGSDTGGSIRIPASMCGVVGIKPTLGRVSRRGAVPLSWSLDQPGPMARRVYDVAALLQATAGYDPQDPYSIDKPVEDYLSGLDEGISSLRVAVAWRGFFSSGKAADDEVLRAFEEAVGVFRSLGAHVSEVTVPQVWEAQKLTLLMIVADAAAYHAERMEREPEDFGGDVLAALQMGATTGATQYATARHFQALLRHSFKRFFAEWDVLLTPSTPVPATLRDERDATRASRPSLVSYTAPFNLAGLPALSVPCGFTTDGLPIGLQIVGGHWNEATVLRAGYAYERETAWHLVEPPLAGVAG